jgi:hypothetical protein
LREVFAALMEQAARQLEGCLQVLPSKGLGGLETNRAARDTEETSTDVTLWPVRHG